jgi:hypothetical protein
MPQTSKTTTCVLSPFPNMKIPKAKNTEGILQMELEKPILLENFY